LRPEGEADVDDVRRLRSRVVLVGLDRLDLVAGPGQRAELVDREPGARLEDVDDVVRIRRATLDLAVVAPVMRQRDGRDRALALRRGEQRRVRRERLEAAGGGLAGSLAARSCGPGVRGRAGTRG